MAKPKNSRPMWIWVSVLILAVCVAATTVVLLSRLGIFLLNDEGAISLIDGNTAQADGSTGEIKDAQNPRITATQAPAAEQKPADNSETAKTAAAAPRAAQQSGKSGFEVSDDNTVWSTDTPVEIFRVSYVNGEQVITVNSDNGEKVIAPGTENSYTFKLKNTGKAALDYTVEVDAFFTPADIEIPITARINRYDGKWIVGGQDEYVKVSELDTAEDAATLGAGKYTYYTLDWLWPFESGDDELDTLLGNLAVDGDLTFTVVIKTTAILSYDPNDDSGITAPDTGDRTDLTLWIVLAVGSFAMMMVLLFCRNKEKQCGSAEANTN